MDKVKTNNEISILIFIHFSPIINNPHSGMKLIFGIKKIK